MHLDRIKAFVSFGMTKLRQQTADGDQRASNTLTRDHIIWGYRFFLDREPENDMVIAEKLNAWSTTKDLRTDFITSLEFRQKNPDLAYMNERNIVIKEIDEQLRLFIDLSDYVIGLGIIRGHYERSEIDFVRRTVKPGQTVLDIGANIGLFTITMAALAGATGKVYAFEPLASNAELLERSIAENGFNDCVTLERAAVSDQSGIAQLISVPNALNSGGAYLLEEQTQVPDGHVAETTKQIALDSYPLRRPVSFIKIDIEGAEPLAFRGAKEILQMDQPVILSEINPSQLKKVTGYTSAQFISEMEAYGYDCQVLEGGRLVSKFNSNNTSDIKSVVFSPKGR